jgi:hypothetical protein
LGIAGLVTSSFTVEIVELLPKIPLPPPPADPDNCRNIPSTLQTNITGALLPLICLNDTQTLYLRDQPAGSRPQLIFSLPPGPHTFGVQAWPDRRPPSNTDGDVDIYCVAVDEGATQIDATNALFASFADGYDTLTFSINATERVWMRCDIDIWIDASVGMTFSTIAPLITLPIRDVDPYDYSTFVAAGSAAILMVDDLNPLNYCGDWKYVLLTFLFFLSFQ